MLTGNKGEWSEIYVLFKLLAEGKLYAADEHLRKLENLFFPIFKVVRSEAQSSVHEYISENSVPECTPGEKVRIYVDGKEVACVLRDKFRIESAVLLNELSDSRKKGAFPVERTETFMKNIACGQLKAKSKDKADIRVGLIDIHTGYRPVVGFSIKSQIGGLSTLLNAGRTTNFIYKLDSEKGNIVKDVNALYTVRGNRNHVDVRARLRVLKDSGIGISYFGTENRVFNDNLVLIDSRMDRILAETLLYYYRDGCILCSELVKRLEEENPMEYGNIKAYEYKFKKFLTAVALGMRPSVEWDGRDEASGGYIIVTHEGDVVAYHIYNRNYFEDYLLNNTKYETASTSRHGFGTIYENGDDKFIKLNLQVRFV